MLQIIHTIQHLSVQLSHRKEWDLNSFLTNVWGGSHVRLCWFFAGMMCAMPPWTKSVLTLASSILI
jgi:hypothetical protein